MCARLRAWVGDLAGFELLPVIYGGGTEERMRALLDERL
jgi:hypothetical protein